MPCGSSGLRTCSCRQRIFSSWSCVSGSQQPLVPVKRLLDRHATRGHGALRQRFDRARRSVIKDVSWVAWSLRPSRAFPSRLPGWRAPDPRPAANRCATGHRPHCARRIGRCSVRSYHHHHNRSARCLGHSHASPLPEAMMVSSALSSNRMSGRWDGGCGGRRSPVRGRAAQAQARLHRLERAQPGSPGREARTNGGAGAEAIEHHDSDRAPTILDAGDQRNRAVVQF